ncbi:77970f4d-f1ba-48ea-80f1-bd2d17f1688e [Thermothielavioides terrestris]|uniref:BTB domain-containing protein n=2 Tax=Thermothielavioides terrestris TaxID=2587410 RepID=G2RGM7_THETT|nr:uncharacterized protein THITE_2123041 [Thermothielavioides terrestris NRRL 8126]AEO71059.1 hypothetical protein THITE_2123041 [Thermothielavioides terrestris NRRL 8126]SPQ20596.1 77970f4d-f1ba-48ea-80f1-bd2d17f1688e [Thermothielavioides terrestris]
MVHSDGGTSLTLRGPSSVVGTSSSGRASGLHSSSRSRRYNRSHAGGSSFVPQNEFPIFSQSGDVEIVVRVPSGHENRYLLHRHILTRCSGFFEASTSSEWSRAQAVPEPPTPGTAGAIEGPKSSGGELARLDSSRGDSSDGGSKPNSMELTRTKKRWRYELDYGSGDNDIPMLVQKEESSNPPPVSNSMFGGPPPGHSASRHSHRKSASHSFFRSVANLALPATHAPSLPPPTPEERDLLRDYDNLFRIMYNYPPVLDGVDIANAYVECKSLLTLADQYDALAVVGARVDHHMLQFQSRLWKQIAKYPISYLRLGYLARSKVIFQEALIHVVGQWPAGERSIRAALPESVVDIIEDKADELEETVSRIEARLFRLTLTTRTGERVTPANGYLEWLAVSLFRQWLAENTTPPPPPVPERRGGGGGSGGVGAGNARDTAGGARGRGGSSSSGSGSGGSGDGHGRLGSHAHSHAQAATPAPAVSPLASVGRTYRLLGAAPGAGPDKGYLGHDECKRFLKLTPELYTRDNLRKFEKRIEELKAMAREVVRPLMGGGLELESIHGAGAAGIGYLTCTTVRDRDFPWEYE